MLIADRMLEERYKGHRHAEKQIFKMSKFIKVTARCNNFVSLRCHLCCTFDRTLKKSENVDIEYIMALHIQIYAQLFLLLLLLL